MSSYQPKGVKKIYHTLKRNLAAAWLSKLHPIQIGITGSQGKTNTTEIVTKVLEKMGPTIRTDVSLDTTFNVPITALRVRPSTRFVIWELGIDHPGEMDAHHEIAQPSIACVTGISPVHTDKEHMGSLETLIKEKRKIIEHLPENGTAVLNRDNEFVRNMASHTQATVKWYGTTPECDMWVDRKSIKITLEGTHAEFYIQNNTHQSQVIKLQAGLIGTHHVYNIMCAYLLVQAALPGKRITNLFSEIISGLKPLPGRMSIEKGPLDTVLLNDSLRANPASTQAGLETLHAIEYKQGRKIAVVGEMGELEDPKGEHQKTGTQIAQLDLDYVICIGPLRKFTINEAIKKGFPKDKIAYAADVFEAADRLRKILKKNDLWYLKGSLLRNYNRIIKLLNGQEVCCDAVLCPYDHCR